MQDNNDFTSKIESKVKPFFDSLNNGVESFVDNIDKKFSALDEEKIEQKISGFFVALGKSIVCFLYVAGIAL